MKIYIRYKLDDINNLFEEKEGKNKYIEIRVLNFKIFRISLNENDILNKIIKKKIEESRKELKKENKLYFSTKVKLTKNVLKMLKIDKIALQIGLNFVDEMINVYSVSILSSVIPLMLNKVGKIEEDNIEYNIFIGEKVLNLDLECILSLNIVKNIPRIINILLIILKGGKKNGTKTSNRISNGYIYDFN